MLSSRILEQKTLSSCLTLGFFKGQLEPNTRKGFLNTHNLNKNQKAGAQIPDRPKFLFNHHIKHLLSFIVCGILYIKTMQINTKPWKFLSLQDKQGNPAQK